MQGINKFWAAITLVYLVILYLTVPVVPGIRKTLTEKYGYEIYNAIYPLFIAVGLWALIAILKCQKGRQKIISLAGVAVCVVIYAAILPNLKYGIERVHFLQYGLLGFMLLGVFRNLIQDWLIYPWTLVLVYLVGLGDEAVQGAIPSRVGEFADVYLNVFSGLLGLFATFFIMPGWRPSWNTSIVSAKKVLNLLILSCLATLSFLIVVHGFGYFIQDNATGDFYSSFSKEKLLKVNTEYSTGEVDANATCIYDNEAFRHLFQRDFYDTNKFYWEPGKFYIDWRKSRNENRVLEKYYSAYLDQNSKQWPADRFRGNPKEDLPWASRVKSTIITGITRRTAILLMIALIAGLLLVRWNLSFKKKTACRSDE